MRGKFNGVQALIEKQFPTAVYVHCFSHSLNLALLSACSISPIRNCMGTIEHCYSFFNSPKRQSLLSEQKSLLPPESNKMRLKNSVQQDG